MTIFGQSRFAMTKLNHKLYAQGSVLGIIGCKPVQYKQIPEYPRPLHSTTGLETGDGTLFLRSLPTQAKDKLYQPDIGVSSPPLHDVLNCHMTKALCHGRRDFPVLQGVDRE